MEAINSIYLLPLNVSNEGQSHSWHQLELTNKRREREQRIMQIETEKNSLAVVAMYSQSYTDDCSDEYLANASTSIVLSAH